MNVSVKPRAAIAIAFLASFLAVGVPYWQVPSPQLSLPGSLWGPALVLVAVAAALLRFVGGTRFWAATLAVATSVPAAILVRIGFDVSADPTTHELWPVEVGIAACIGFLVSLLGALAGRIVAHFLPQRAAATSFDLVAIGDDWREHSLVHDGVSGTLRVRQLPDGLVRSALGLVALAQVDDAEASAVAKLTRRIQQALEQRGSLLVLVHHQAGRVHWYAYGATRASIDEAFASLDDPAVHWGINEDAGWAEYDHAKSLVE